jgi:PPM family protein phosphatase
MSADQTPEPAGSDRQDVTINVFGRTDVGRTREHNEDSFVVADLSTGNATLHPEVRMHVVGERGTLFMVADGMGGAAAGEIASAMAVEVVLEEIRKRWVAAAPTDSDKFAAAIKAATEMANTKIHRFAAEHPEHRGMGTTATIAGYLEGMLYVAQVGDSRAYLVRDGTIKQITKDQSLMQKLIEANELTEEEAERSDRRNIILQALGPEATVKVDLTNQQVRRGDTLILCSDGLSGQMRKEDMLRVVMEEPDLMTVCKRLIDMANENGGPDNITVIAARFEGAGLDAAGTDDEVGHRVYKVEEIDTPTAPMERFTRRSHAKTVPIEQNDVPTDPHPMQAVTAESEVMTPPGIRRTSQSRSGGAAMAAPPDRRREGRMYLIAIAIVGIIVAAALAWKQFVH